MVWSALIVLSAPIALDASTESPAPAASPLHDIEPWMEVPFTTSVETILEAAKDIEAPKGTDVHILFDDASHHFDAQGRSTSRQLYIYRILTRDGMDTWSTAGAAWSPWHQEKPQVKARVLTLSGDERWLDETTLSEAPATEASADMFNDRRILQAPLPALEIGSVVIEEVIVRDHQPLFAAGTNHREYLVNNQPVFLGRLVLQAPTTVPLRYGQRLADGVELERHLLQIGDQETIQLIFKYGNTSTAELPPPNLPLSQPRFPSVIFSTGESWNAIAKAYAEIVDGKLIDADLTEVLVGFPVAGDRQKKIDFLLARVQENVRYTGLELGAASIIPATPAEILERQFGDCKDQATLLVALLRQVDIEAHVALLRARVGDDVEPQLPGLGLFNHAIVYLPGDRPLWIDPTAPFARAGELPLSDQGRWALVAATTTQALIPTPTSNSVENRIVETREIYLADYGNAKVVESSEYHGSFERQQRTYRSGNVERFEGIYRTYIKNEYAAGSLESFEATPFDDLTVPFTLRLTALEAQRASTDLEEAALTLTYGDLFGEIPDVFFEEHETSREDDFVLFNPFVKEWVYRIHLPAGFEPRGVPQNQIQKIGNMRYEESFSYEDDVLQANVRLDSGLRRLTPELFEATRLGLEELSQSETTVLYFDHVGTTHLAAGRSREAIQAFRQLAEEHPQEAIHRVRLARALLAVGMGGEARRQARLASETEKTSAVAQWILGFSLVHDEIGRPHHPGFDLAGALTALERSRDLDTTNPFFWAEFAILLDYDAAGKRYSKEANLGQAIEEYQHWRQSFDRSTLDEYLLSTLFHSQRWQELHDVAEELDSSVATRDAWRLIALGALDGPKAVLDAARRRGKDHAEQIRLLNAAAQKLTAIGQFSTASSILRQTANHADNPAAALQEAEVMSRIRPLDEMSLPSDDPATPLKQFFVQVLSEEPDVEALEALFHPDLIARENLDREKLLHLYTTTQAEMLQARASLPREALLELVLSTFEFTADGDDGTGYRLAIESQLADFGYRSTAYVKPWQDGYRIVALDRDFAALGREALARFQAGDLVATRQYLDWGRDLVSLRPSDDPLVGNVLARHWKKGREADIGTIHLAVLLLLAQDSRSAEEADAPLEQLLATEEDPQRQLLLHLALTLCAQHKKDWGKLEEHTRWLFQAEPTSDVALNTWIAGLEGTGQEQALTQLANDLLQKDPEDFNGLRIQANQHLRRGQFEAAFEKYNAMSGSENAVAKLNSLAWAKLFVHPVTEEVLELAQKSAALNNYQSYAILHTLAMAYAELERPLEAYRVLLQGLKVRGSSELEDSDLLIVGRIAQSYGLVDVARDLYQRIEPPADSVDPLLSWHLAQIHLAELAPDKPGRRGKKNKEP